MAEHVVDLSGVDRLVASEACRLFLDRIATRASVVWIDAFSDVADLPSDAQAARLTLLGRQPGGMGIELDPHDGTDRRLLNDFALWSINAEAHTGTTIVGAIHDTGDSLWFLGDESDAAAFRAVGVHVTTTPPATARRAPRRLWGRLR